MLRRDFVRAAITVSVAPRALLSQQATNPQLPPPAPVPWTLGLNPKTPLPHTEPADLVAEPKLVFFTALQMAVLVGLCDLLMPPLGNKPGALRAQTPQFLDFLIGTSPNSSQNVYTSGLEWLNQEALRRYKMPFGSLDNRRADSIIRPWLRTWLSDHPPLEFPADFINLAHHDIRTATVNSKEWNDVPSVGAQEKTAVGLYWEPIEPEIAVPVSRLPRSSARITSQSKANHEMPEYSR